MFSFLDPKASSSRAVVSTGHLPQFVDPAQPPSKKKPYGAIMNQPFTHTVEVLLPEELYDLVWRDVDAKISQVQYCRVIMPLSALLEGDFFNMYIKTGNILMLSEGRPGVDDRYSLKDGILRLELAKDMYERSGLGGKPMSDGGRKHMKTRFAVELDLRQPSMLHGKRGFERIIWAFRNVLNRSVTWLFHDLEVTSDQSNGRPIAKHHPFMQLATAQGRTIDAVVVPDLNPTQAMSSADDFEAWTLDIYEWVGLVGMESPRVLVDDAIDTYLSRYQLPTSDRDSPNVLKLRCLTFHGLLPESWIRSLFIKLSKGLGKVTKQRQAFFTLSAHAFDTKPLDQLDGYSVLCLSDEKGREKQDAVITQSGPKKEASRVKDLYVLWELS